MGVGGARDPGADVRMRGFGERAGVAGVRAMVLERAQPLDPETVRLEEAWGRVLARDVTAAAAVPGFERAMMDGYAVRAEETAGASESAPRTFRVAGEVLPGRGFPGRVGRGDAVRIMTGAPLPAGADAVVPAEYASERGEGGGGGGDEGGRLVEITRPVAPRRHVGAVGEDVQRGTLLLRRGRLLRPQDVGILASVGVCDALVYRRPRVRLIVTGDELLPVGSRPEGFRIVDSNSLMLDALVRRDGGIPLRSAIVPDRREGVEAALVGSDSDAILVSGGSSVGAEDHAPLVVARLGRLLAHGIAMRPAAPAGVGWLEGRLVFLLPGNPVACLCAYDFFAGPAVRRLGGRSPAWPYRRLRLPLAGRIASKAGRLDYVRVRVERGEGGGAEPLAARGASVLSSTTRADGFVIVPPEREEIPAGEGVEVHLYDPGGDAG